MSDILLAGDAQAVAQVDSLDITAYDAATTYRVTIGGKIVGVAGTTDAPTTEAAYVTAHNASLYNEFEEITATRPSGSVLLTADTLGKSFVAASSVSGGAGTIGAVTPVTACEGPSVLSANNCKNASTGARTLPVAADTLTLEHLDVDLLYGLEALAGLTLAALYINASFEAQCGLPPYNAAGAYDEYRPLYLKAPASLVRIGAGDGDGSPLVMYDAGSVQTAIEVYATDTPALDGLHACMVKGTHASNTLKVTGDSTVDVAPFAGEVATFLTVTVTGNAEVRTGKGTTLGTLHVGGSATVEIDSAAALADITAINVYDEATVIIRGDNAVTAINAYGPTARVVYLSSGTAAAVNLFDGAQFDCEENPSSFTITTLGGSGAPTINDPNSRMTVTNAIGANNSNVFAWTWQLKPSRTITLGAP
ncbi:MAG: hypothetical protein M3Q42_11790 [Pseudomonadota bacterium]|nr:hypothetical protein [Pseudomonadota bacterium]